MFLKPIVFARDDYHENLLNAFLIVSSEVKSLPINADIFLGGFLCPEFAVTMFIVFS